MAGLAKLLGDDDSAGLFHVLGGAGLGRRLLIPRKGPALVVAEFQLHHLQGLLRIDRKEHHADVLPREG